MSWNGQFLAHRTDEAIQSAGSPGLISALIQACSRGKRHKARFSTSTGPVSGPLPHSQGCTRLAVPADSLLMATDESLCGMMHEIAETDALSGLLTHDAFMRCYMEFFAAAEQTYSASGSAGPSHLRAYAPQGNRTTGGGVLMLIGIDNYALLEEKCGAVSALGAFREIGAVLQRFRRNGGLAGRLSAEGRYPWAGKDDKNFCSTVSGLPVDFALLLQSSSLHRTLERCHLLARALRDITLINRKGAAISVKVNLGLKPFQPGDAARLIFDSALSYRQQMIAEDNNKIVCSAQASLNEDSSKKATPEDAMESLTGRGKTVGKSILSCLDQTNNRGFSAA